MVEPRPHLDGTNGSMNWIHAYEGTYCARAFLSWKQASVHAVEVS